MTATANVETILRVIATVDPLILTLGSLRVRAIFYPIETAGAQRFQDFTGAVQHRVERRRRGAFAVLQLRFQLRGVVVGAPQLRVQVSQGRRLQLALGEQLEVELF